MKNILKNPIFLIIVGLIVTLAVTSSIIIFLILPMIDEYSKSKAVNDASQVKLDTLSKNVSSVRNFSISKDEVDFLKLFYPNENDGVRFAALNEKVAGLSGIAITSFVLVLAPSQTLTGGTASGSTGGNSSKAAAVASTPAPTQNGYSVQVFYKGDYPKFITFLENTRKMKRLNGISKVSFNSVIGSPQITGSVTFFLPLSQAVLSVGAAENFIPVTDGEKTTLSGIIDNAQFDSSPSARPLGKDNPFE